MMQPSAVMRLVAIAVMAVSLTTVTIAPAVAQREPDRLTGAQQVRELVLKHREEVLARIEAILSGKKDMSQQARAEPAEETDATAEASEPEAEDGEPEGAEIEDVEPESGEGEDGEAEDEEVLELPETGVGRFRGASEPLSTLMAAVGALAAAGLSVRRRFV